MAEQRRDSRRVRAAIAVARARDERARARCWICRQPIDYELPYLDEAGQPNLDAYEADHVLPWSTHPEHRADPANLKASHVRCNRTRGDRTARPALGQLSRAW